MKIVERDFCGGGGGVLEGTVSIDGSSFFLPLFFYFDVQIRVVPCVLYTMRG